MPGAGATADAPGLLGAAVGSPHGEKAVLHRAHTAAVASASAWTPAPQAGQWTVVAWITLVVSRGMILLPTGAPLQGACHFARADAKPAPFASAGGPVANSRHGLPLPAPSPVRTNR